MLHVFMSILVWATPVDGAHRAGANGEISFFPTYAECAAASQKGGDAISRNGAVVGEEVLGTAATCIDVFVPTESPQATALRHQFEMTNSKVTIHKHRTTP